MFRMTKSVMYVAVAVIFAFAALMYTNNVHSQQQTNPPAAGTGTTVGTPGPGTSPGTQAGTPSEGTQGQAQTAEGQRGGGD